MATRQNRPCSTAVFYDSFSETWGASTRWKTESPRSGRFELEQESNPSHGVDLSMAPALRQGSATTTNKPLPPLPHQATAVSPGATFKMNLVGFSKQPRASVSSGSSFGNLLRWGRRYSIFKKIAKRSSTRDQSLAATTVAPTLDTFKSHVYVDKATQTSHELLQQQKPRKLSFERRAESHDDDQSLITSETRTPVWSPKKSLASTGPSDYFSLPPRPTGRKSSKVLGNVVDSSTDSPDNLQNDDSPAAAKRPWLIRDDTKDSSGTYESRYSERPSENNFVVGRPVKRKAVSDSTIPEVLNTQARSKRQPIRSEEAGSLSSISPVERMDMLTSKDGEEKRPMPFPFQRIPSFSGQRGRPRYKRATSSSNSGSNISPLHQDSPHHRASQSPSSARSSSLRQEVSATSQNKETKPKSLDVDDAAVLQNLVQTLPLEMATVTHSDIPDHLRSSPLCPRHPKHKSGGTGFCPIHGQNRSSLGDSSDSEAAGKQGQKPSKEVSTSSSDVPGTLTDGASQFLLGPPDHHSDDPHCPANMQIKGVCLHHGRALLSSSLDSVPRLAIV